MESRPDVRIGSLCSGVDLLALGLEWAGAGSVVWQAELELHASTVLDQRFGVPNHGDIKSACWERVEPIDILVGGIPCQPWSAAGRRAGTADVLGRPTPSPTDEKGRLSPVFVEWMMGAPEGWVSDLLPRNASLRCLGNAVVPQVSALAWNLLSKPPELDQGRDLGVEREGISVVGVGVAQRFGAEPQQSELDVGEFEVDHAPASSIAGQFRQGEVA